MNIIAAINLSQVINDNDAPRAGLNDECLRDEPARCRVGEDIIVVRVIDHARNMSHGEVTMDEFGANLLCASFFIQIDVLKYLGSDVD